MWFIPAIGMAFFDRLFRRHERVNVTLTERRKDPIKRRAFKEKAELDAAVERIRRRHEYPWIEQTHDHDDHKPD